MRAVVLRETGDADLLRVEDVPEPEGDTIAVGAAGVNFLDVLVRQGRYPQPPPLPATPGIEVAGDVDGRRVLALLRQTGGGYAERASIDPSWVFPLPERASYEEGASRERSGFCRGKRFAEPKLPFRKRANGWCGFPR